MRKLLCSMFAIALLFCAWGVSPAQQPAAGASKPLLVVSFAGYDALRGNIDAIGKLAGNPGLAAGAEEPLIRMTQGKGLAGLDKTKPCGLVVPCDGSETSFEQLGHATYGFVPVTDLKQLMTVIGGFTHQQFTPDADGVYEIKDSVGTPAYVIAKGGWAFISESREVLKNVPADPAATLGDLPKQYTLAARLSLKNLPAGIRKMAISQLEAGFHILSMWRGSNEDEASRSGRRHGQTVAKEAGDGLQRSG